MGGLKNGYKCMNDMLILGGNRHHHLQVPFR